MHVRQVMANYSRLVIFHHYLQLTHTISWKIEAEVHPCFLPWWFSSDTHVLLQLITLEFDFGCRNVLTMANLISGKV